MFTIVGLENQAGRSMFARHAVGGRFLDFIVSKNGATWQRNGNVEVAVVTLAGEKVRLMRMIDGKLHTCGEVLAPSLLDVVDPSTLIVIYDEAGMEIGESNFSSDGFGDNGHLGLRNLVRELGFDSFPRGGIGIGKIPQKDQWEQFFNSELSAVDQMRVNNAFVPLLDATTQFIEAQKTRSVLGGKFAISRDIAGQAQLPGRTRNMTIAPMAVGITHRDAKQLTEAVTTLVSIIQRNANAYARLCHESQDPSVHPLVRELEAGISHEFIPLVRSSQFHVEGISFDFQSGKLVEINAAPMPMLTVSRVKQLLGINGPGQSLTLNDLCRRASILASRHHKGGRKGLVVLLNQIGEIPIGRTGWLESVEEHLNKNGIPTSIGSQEMSEDADVIWANITYLMDGRLESVITQKVERKTAQIIPSPRNFLFTSKRFLTLLSSDSGRELLGIGIRESAALDNIIPWTKLLDGNKDTVRFIVGTGRRLFGKPFISSGGRGGSRILKLSDLKDVVRPAVVQEWLEPYKAGGGAFNYDIRICVYGEQGSTHVWQARLWEGNSQLQRPMDAPVVFVD